VLPDVPTVGEFVPGYEASGWSGVAEINTALADLKIKAQLADLGSTVLAGSPANCAKLIAQETEKWGKVIQDANIKPE